MLFEITHMEGVENCTFAGAIVEPPMFGSTPQKNQTSSHQACQFWSAGGNCSLKMGLFKIYIAILSFGDFQLTNLS